MNSNSKPPRQTFNPAAIPPQSDAAKAHAAAGQYVFGSAMLPQGDGTYVLKPGKSVVEVTVKMAGFALGVCRSLAYEYVASGLLPHRRPSPRKIWVPAEAVLKLRERTLDPGFWKTLKKHKAARQA